MHESNKLKLKQSKLKIGKQIIFFPPSSAPSQIIFFRGFNTNVKNSYSLHVKSSTMYTVYPIAPEKGWQPLYRKWLTNMRNKFDFTYISSHHSDRICDHLWELMRSILTRILGYSFTDIFTCKVVSKLKYDSTQEYPQPFIMDDVHRSLKVYASKLYIY